MKTRFTYWTCIALLGVMAVSCEDHQLEDFTPEETEPRIVSAGGLSGTIGKDNERVTLPVSVTLSAPAATAFQVGLRLNNDTVAALIGDQTLENTVLLPPGTVQLPGVVEIPYGADTALFEVSIGIGALEQIYGHQTALAVDLVNPGKGNRTDPGHRTSLIMLNTAELLDPDEIHYLAIVQGGGDTLVVRQGSNYQVTSAGVTIPLDISLAGTPGRSFTVKARVNTDTIATLAGNGTLPENTVALQPEEYNLDTLIRVGAGSSLAPFDLSIPWPAMDNHLDHPVALAISLDEPSRHVLHEEDKTVVVLVDPSVNLDNNSFIEGDGTGLKAEYFRENQLLDSDGQEPDLVRIDPNIDFEGWQPFPDADDNWSTRWTGEFLAPVRGEYTFYQTQWDDGARLFIGGEALVDDFTTEWNKPERFGTVYLERGQRYTIEAHHRENVGGQQAKLEYEVSEAGVTRQIVPQSQLYPAD